LIRRISPGGGGGGVGLVMLRNMANPTFQMKKKRSPPPAHQMMVPKEGILDRLS
jgi:hypothetical protein